MILVVGGAYQGKESFARSLCVETKGMDPGIKAVSGENAEWETLFSEPFIRDFHLFVKRALEEGRDVSQLADEIGRLNPDAVLITNELGCGIVPADPADRIWRETTGRICIRLAEQAQEVWRVVCGIGERLK